MPLRPALTLFSLAFSATLLYSQSVAPTVAPGLSLPSGNLPWALDHVGSQPQLVPVHHSTVEVNNHKGANLAGSLAGSFFYKPKVTTELAGLHARTRLHDATPSFYLHMQQDTDTDGETAKSETMTWALIRAVVNQDHRVFAKVQFNQLTMNAKRTDGLVQVSKETLPGGWVKLTPTAPLQPGEYAISPILKTPNTFATVIWDFTLDPAAPVDADVVLPKPAP